MNFRFALLAATVLAAPIAFSRNAAAQPVSGPYVSLGAGYNIQNGQKAKNVSVNNAATTSTGSLSFDNGYDVTGSAGYGFGNGFRLEVEGDFIRGGANNAALGGAGAQASGHEGRYGVFGNAYYDFDIGLPWLYPYVGAGLGWQNVGFDSINAGGAHVSDSRSALAYQAIGGISYPMPWVPGLSATLEYRFVTTVTGRKYHGEYGGQPMQFDATHEYNHEINVGLRYQLFTPQPVAPAPNPAAAPVAAPAPVPAKTYLVFFDWNKYNLTPRATQIIAQAASDSHTNNVTTLQVSGYTDTSGTAKYNMGLSERRAQAVALQLVADGVPKSEIEIQAYGETHLLVPTGPGVREPQNRRVEIVLQ
jgi:outer membrane protein OmpA-like peptidoglycan-associated protein